MTKTIREMIEVMEAFERGESIECKHKTNQHWASVTYPSWDWSVVDYRVAITPDSINWSHVSSEYKYMARDKSGSIYLFTEKPNLFVEDWCTEEGSMIPVFGFSSYKKGTVSWDKSLVERPSN